MPGRQGIETMTTDDDKSDPELQSYQRALVSLSVEAVPSAEPIDPDRLWAAVAGELPSREAQAVVDAALLDPAAHEELRLALAIRDALSQGQAPPRQSGSWSRSWWTMVLAVAAALLAVLTLRPLDPSPGLDSPIQFRGGAGTAQIEAGPATLPAERFELRWEGRQGAHYDVRVSTDEPRLLIRKRGLTEPRFVVPPETFEGLPSGTRILWQVEVVTPDGRKERSQTSVVRLK